MHGRVEEDCRMGQREDSSSHGTLTVDFAAPAGNYGLRKVIESRAKMGGDGQTFILVSSIICWVEVVWAAPHI